jgi:hypothetical protein
MPSRRVLVCLTAALAALLLGGCGQSSVQDQVDALGGALGNGQGLGKRLDLNGSDLYYTSSVTTAEAKRLRRHLLETHTFDGAAGTLQLNRDGSRYQFRMMVQPGAENDQQTIFASNALAMRLSGAVFGGKVVEIHLCDQNFDTLRVVDPIGGSGGSTN